MDKKITDREIYPAGWITLGCLLLFWIVWKYFLGMPPIGGCWIYETYHLYCPGCGGTRAVIALFEGEVFQSFYYHPIVPVMAGLAVVYMTSQTFFRMRGKNGWVLRYDERWIPALFVILMVNCVFRNFLLYGFGIEI